MADEDQSPGWLDGLWLLAIGLAGSMLVVSASLRTGGTFDEAFYLETGLQRWRTGSTARFMDAGTMPLPIDVETLPAYIWERVRGRPWDLVGEFHDALAIARHGTLLFWWLTMYYGWRIARGSAGPWAGRLAALLLALEPTLLAHGGLATTDVAVTGCLLMFGYHYARGRDGNWRQRVGLPALLGGLTILAKASGLVFVPLCLLAIEFERRWRRSEHQSWWPRFKDALAGLVAPGFRHEAAVIAALALILVFVYCGSDWEAHPKIVAAAHEMAPGAGRDICVWLAEHARIFNNAGVGLWFQIHHNLHGHGSYLLGQTAPRAVWYYFPVAFSIKLPVALLATPLLLLLIARRNLFNWPLLASLGMLIFSLNCRVQIGVRIQLPLIALCCVGSAIALARTFASASSLQRVAGRCWAGAAVLWLGAAAALSWPQYLSYVNESWGGPEHGERLLSDSNFDWGQGLPELKAWCAERGVSDMPVWYFGTDADVLRPPFRFVALHTIDLAGEKELRAQVRGPYLAVSATILFGSYVNQPEWLISRMRAVPPTDRTRTFFIYDVNDLLKSDAPASTGAGGLR